MQQVLISCVDYLVMGQHDGIESFHNWGGFFSFSFSKSMHKNQTEQWSGEIVTGTFPGLKVLNIVFFFDFNQATASVALVFALVPLQKRFP